MTTKERILEESMKLFAVSGFESVSVRTIAAAVGVRDSALYKHYSNKQAIFDAIVEKSIERFKQQYQEVGIEQISKDTLVDTCLSMFRFQTKDNWVNNFRQILILEQFRNPDMAALYKQIFVDMPIGGQAEIFKELISRGIMKDCDPVVMSMELYAPFFLYHTVKEEPEILQERLKKHVENFMSMYCAVD